MHGTKLVHGTELQFVPVLIRCRPHMKVWGKVQLTMYEPTTTTALQMNQSSRGCRCMGRESTSSGSNICRREEKETGGEDIL